tara:strand:+ start:4903 stop:5655 length:753 start_codon:yes stop_codon:yes gene_type:complete
MNLKIALVGYGRMGKSVEKVATARGHDIVAKIDPNLSTSIVNCPALVEAEVAVEFSTPETAPANIQQLATKGIQTVSGTTGWYEALDKTTEAVQANGTGLIYAPNFSLGVHILMELVRVAGRMSHLVKGYETSIHESHHKYKLDTPSGTAISLADALLEQIPSKTRWVLGLPSVESDAETIHITSEREGENPGRHVIDLRSEHDNIEISHQAHSRDGFALGAVLAAEWICGKVGIFTLNDMFTEKEARCL